MNIKIQKLVYGNTSLSYGDLVSGKTSRYYMTINIAWTTCIVEQLRANRNRVYMFDITSRPDPDYVCQTLTGRAHLKR